MGLAEQHTRWSFMDIQGLMGNKYLQERFEETNLVCGPPLPSPPPPPFDPGIINMKYVHTLMQNIGIIYIFLPPQANEQKTEDGQVKGLKVRAETFYKGNVLLRCASYRD